MSFQILKKKRCARLSVIHSSWHGTVPTVTDYLAPNPYSLNSSKTPPPKPCDNQKLLRTFPKCSLGGGMALVGITRRSDSVVPSESDFSCHLISKYVLNVCYVSAPWIKEYTTIAVKGLTAWRETQASNQAILMWSEN